MGSRKHSLVDGEVRPRKKTKLQTGDNISEQHRQTEGKKLKKSNKKSQKPEEDLIKPIGHESVVTHSDAEACALRKAEKAAKKAKKHEKGKKKKEEQKNLAKTSHKLLKDTAQITSKNKYVPETTESSQDYTTKRPIKLSDTAKEPNPLRNKYTQTISLSTVAQDEINDFLLKNNISITDPKGETSRLRPVIDFHHLPSTNLLEKRPSIFVNFTNPTPIQAASWPSTLSGRDVVGVAETGSGKTMAFALPCVEAVSIINRKGIKAVIVSPTRELAMQTHSQLASIAALAKLKCVCLYGGASKDDQRALLKRGCDIIVATPGRLKDFMSDGTADLGGCMFAVLDEADRMLDKGFEDDIKQILGACVGVSERQTLMFTATWPQSVQGLASTFMTDPVKVTISSGGKEAEDGSVELQANKRITQQVEVIDPKDKEFRLLQILKQHQQGKQKNDRILVFCLYKKEATRIENFLSRKGIRVGGIHGDLKQEQRTRSLEAFKTGQTPVLVATDVAARGLDIPEVKLVINVTFPLTIEDYVHRIGRTGRAGSTGKAHTLFTLQDKAHSGSLVNVLKSANQEIPEDLLKFGTTVKKKTHDMYGSFFKDVDMTQKATKITFD